MSIHSEAAKKLEPGMKVRILGKEKNGENGWGTCWNQEMDKYIGKIGEIKEIDDHFGVKFTSDFYNGNGWFYFPAHKLEIIEELPSIWDFVKDDYVAIAKDKSKTIYFFMNEPVKGKLMWIDYMESHSDNEVLDLTKFKETKDIHEKPWDESLILRNPESKTKTITLDGKDIEISEESYNAFKEQFKDV